MRLRETGSSDTVARYRQPKKEPLPMSPSVYNPPILADRKPPACQGEDPELWFAGERQPLEQAAAVALCSICSQRSVCLQRALRDEQDQPANAIFGIFGGLFPAERLLLARSAA